MKVLHDIAKLGFLAALLLAICLLKFMYKENTLCTVSFLVSLKILTASDYLLAVS